MTETYYIPTVQAFVTEEVWGWQHGDVCAAAWELGDPPPPMKHAGWLTPRRGGEILRVIAHMPGTGGDLMHCVTLEGEHVAYWRSELRRLAMLPPAEPGPATRRSE